MNHIKIFLIFCFLLNFATSCKDKKSSSLAFSSATSTTDVCDKDDFDLELVASEDTSCEGQDQIKLEVQPIGGSGSVAYSWKDEEGNLLSDKKALEGTGGGEYTLLAKDLVCEDEVQKTFITSELGTLTLSLDKKTNPSCPGSSNGSAQITVLGGSGEYSYSWLNSKGKTISSKEDPSQLSDGEYTLKVQDTVCQEELTQKVSFTEPETLSIQVEDSTESDCSNESSGFIDVTVSGGSGSYQYTWENEEGSQVSTKQDLEGVDGGTYTLTLKDKTCGTKETKTFSFSELSSLSVSFENTEATSCPSSEDGSAEAVVSGGSGRYSYSWVDEDSEEISTTESLSDVPKGEYTLTVKDLDCKNTLESVLEVGGPDSISLEIEKVTDTSCYEADEISVDVSVTGGSGEYQYQWTYEDEDFSTEEDLENVGAGEYVLFVKDAECGESLSESFDTEELTELSVSIEEENDASCPSAQDGSIEAKILGGSGSYAYSWLDAEGTEVSTEEDPTGLLPGEYTLALNDTVCENTLEITAEISAPSDNDCDGILTDDDCDDSDANSNSKEEDEDCDDLITEQDCNDNDANSNSREEDGDCDGLLTEEDCNDYDPNSLSLSEDADCDSVSTEEDCNDYDPEVSEHSFTRHLVEDSINGVQSLALADFDLDGDLDIAVVAEGDSSTYANYPSSTGKVMWFENDGAEDPSFTRHNIKTYLTEIVAAGDLNGDGYPDIVTGSYTTVFWYKNDGDGTFTKKTVANSGFYITTDLFLIDLDKDGDLDILQAASGDYSSFKGFYWYENDGSDSPSFTAHNIDSEGYSGVVSFDMDDDDDLDLLTQTSSNDDKLTIHENEEGSFTESRTGSGLQSYGDGLNFADIDQDGDFDILFYGSDAFWLMNDGSGSFSKKIVDDSHNANDLFRWMEGVDFDGDGDTDVLAANGNKVSFYKNDGSQNFDKVSLSSSINTCSDFESGDLDGDGDLDVAAVAKGVKKVFWIEQSCE